jgi:hypothetical protein
MTLPLKTKTIYNAKEFTTRLVSLFMDDHESTDDEHVCDDEGEVDYNKRYVGERDDKRRPHGHGIMTESGGIEVYEGEFVHGYRCGKGVQKCFHLRTFSSHTGEWKNDMSNGYGVQDLGSGERYEGEWLNGFQVGVGTELKENGDFYEGNFVKSKRHGFGKLTDSGGKCVYEGEWKKGKKHGYGTITHVSGESFRVYMGERIPREE